MKKIFLPLLAAVGMALGLTLSSCGGGGGTGSAGKPAKALVGTTIVGKVGTPQFSLQFDTEEAGWFVNSYFTPGSSRSFPCTYALTRDPKLENGYWEFWGELSWTGIDILKNNDFLALLGVNNEASSCQLEKFVMILQIPAGKQQTGSYQGKGQMNVSGRYFMSDGESEGTKLEEDPREITFVMTGMLKEEYLQSFNVEKKEESSFDY